MAETVLERLAERAEAEGQKEAFSFQGRQFSYAELWRSVCSWATQFEALGVQGKEAVLIALPNGPAFFEVFYGLQLAGGIPVPLFPGSGAARLERLAAKVRASLAVVPAALVGEYQAGGQTLAFIPDEQQSFFTKKEIHLPRPKDLAFIQFTSGSGGTPKGVQITQGGLVTNLKQMIRRMKFTPEDIFVSWLPVYHDMGLILMTMVPFFLGCRLELLPARLTGLREWIQALSNNRATFTAAPDFAYRLSLAYVRDGHRYDLSPLRAALSGAEQVRWKTAQDFEAAFGLQNVMVAGYGLAEATVGVSMTRPGQGLCRDQSGLVSVGSPLEGIEIAIAGEDGRRLKSGDVGEVLVRSPANSPGYYGDPEANAALFTEDGFMRTGDLGHVDDQGELFILARKKNIIKHAGRTVAPQEIEAVVEDDPRVRGCAAVGIDSGGLEGEQAWVFAELRYRRRLENEEYHEIGVALVESIHAQLGFRPGRLLLVSPGTIPRTPNGKLQHMRLREMYLAGEIKSHILFP